MYKSGVCESQGRQLGGQKLHIHVGKFVGPVLILDGVDAEQAKQQHHNGHEAEHL